MWERFASTPPTTEADQCVYLHAGKTRASRPSAAFDTQQPLVTAASKRVAVPAGLSVEEHRRVELKWMCGSGVERVERRSPRERSSGLGLHGPLVGNKGVVVVAARTSSATPCGVGGRRPHQVTQLVGCTRAFGCGDISMVGCNVRHRGAPLGRRSRCASASQDLGGLEGFGPSSAGRGQVP